MIERIYTTGVYGFDEDSFFEQFQRHQIDTFCDIRSRRGLRGSQYAFANSLRLQKRLSELGIRYLHLKMLAPSEAVRKRQKDADAASSVLKRDRSQLGEEFIAGYQEEILDDLSPQSVIEALGNEARNVVFFCVERDPKACHRLLLVNHLNQYLKLEMEHLSP